MRTLAWMNSSMRPLGKRPRRRGPWPCRDMHSNVRTSSSLSKNSSTPSPYTRTSTVRASLSSPPVGHRAWYTSLVMAPLSGTTSGSRPQPATSSHSTASSRSSRRASSGMLRSAGAGAASAGLCSLSFGAIPPESTERLGSGLDGGIFSFPEMGGIWPLGVGARAVRARVFPLLLGFVSGKGAGINTAARDGGYLPRELADSPSRVAVILYGPSFSSTSK
jgi:hypothetical protein